jgi:hypothetical protein
MGAGRAGSAPELPFETLAPWHWTLRVNEDWVIHLGRWDGHVIGELPGFLLGSVNPNTRRLVLRVPSAISTDAADGEFGVTVVRRSDKCIARLPELRGIGARVGSDLRVEATRRRLIAWRIR